MPDLLDSLASLAERYPDLRLDLLWKLLLAAILGGAIGWEREYANKPAGLRTNMLICIGAALLTDLSVQVAAGAQWPADPGRIAAQIVSGIGFLGAGTIIQSRGSVTGLTTAATMWVVAGIGMAVGFGALIEAVGATVLVLIALIPLGWIEVRAEHRRRQAELGSIEAPAGPLRPMSREEQGPATPLDGED